ncbi:MAG: hemolysin [Variovorax sp.]|nr:hemolysin [Variovorax sp.]
MTAQRLVICRGERFNGYSHLLGLMLAIGGAAVLLPRAFASGEPAKIIGALVFAVCAVALYAASALFHSAQGRARAAWERADHCAIYLLIAGTCTPFVLVALPAGWAAALLAAIWSFALFGIARELRPADPSTAPQPSLRIYVAMGWLCVLTAAPLAARLDGLALAGLLAGAAVYTAGTVFYRNRRGWTHAHGVWHLFVLGGTMTHYFTVARLML